MLGIWTVVGHPVTPQLVLVVAATLLGIVLTIKNLMTIMNYRMQTRVYNAFFVLVLIMAVVALCIDYGNAAVYLPLLGLMVAIQVAHAHTLGKSPLRYVSLLLLIVGCIAFYTIQLL